MKNAFIHILPKNPPIHVLPINDLKKHSESLEKICACKPEIKGEGETILVIHNAYDGRL